jgi:hypothetical protein
MIKPIDHSVYPDVAEPPTSLRSDEERADYIHRICSAWDFGILPTRETFAMFKGWRAVFDRYPLRGSPAYHAFRALFRWTPVVADPILEAAYERIDRREGRTDPYHGRV